MSTMPDRSPDPPGQETTKSVPKPISLSKIIFGTVVLAVLTVIGTYVFGGFTDLSAGGVMALIIGVTASYALGVGLMVAVFYSSRFYDDSAHQAARDQFKDREKDP
jgi:predicted phage tail protein